MLGCSRTATVTCCTSASPRNRPSISRSASEVTSSACACSARSVDDAESSAAIVNALDGATPAELKALEAELANDESDHAARVKLAVQLTMSAHHRDALEHLLVVLRVDRDWNNGEAKRLYLDTIASIGKGDPLAHPRITIACRAELPCTEDFNLAGVEAEALPNADVLDEDEANASRLLVTVS